MANKNIGISVVVPFFNEARNVRLLYQQLKDTLKQIHREHELIFVDDGSTDDTYKVLSEIYDEDDMVEVIRLCRNFGQTAALAAGFEIARGEIAISMDGDLQHDPGEIPKFLEKIEEGFDVVSGWRKERIDSFWTRRLPSLIANRIIRRLSGINIHDFGTTFKAYRTSVIKNLELFGDMHRYIPVLAARMGASITEIPIKNKPRLYGSSNYGLSRTGRVILDLIALKYLTAFISNPLRLFGLLGLTVFATGFLISAALVLAFFIGKIATIRDHLALLLLSILLMVIGAQFITSGITAEINARIYHKMMDKRSYVVKEMRTRRLKT
ncbi:MAG: glycosyltransferase family 2 protein [Candidatus Omnitrophica bacterium]|nr:glycosyltransferase family 2 protein [Candidatus Omnitrophota bacterium]